MEQATPAPAAHSTTETTEAVNTATRFLTALFDKQDLVLFRPIETWIEEGRKRSRADYRNTRYRKAVPALLQTTVLQLLASAEQEHTNLFFGVCPRLGPKARFDLAWQIRTVRTLWTDIDHVSVEEASERVSKAGMPLPALWLHRLANDRHAVPRRLCSAQAGVPSLQDTAPNARGAVPARFQADRCPRRRERECVGIPAATCSRR